MIEPETDESELTPKIKKNLLIACLFALLVGNMMLLNVASFLPSYIEDVDWDDGETISTFEISLIISVFSVA